MFIRNSLCSGSKFISTQVDQTEIKNQANKNIPKMFFLFVKKNNCDLQSNLCAFDERAKMPIDQGRRSAEGVTR